MTPLNTLALRLTLAAAVVAAHTAARAEINLPAHELTFQEIIGMGNLAPMALPPLKVAAALKVAAYDKGSPQRNAQRNSGGPAALYAGLPAAAQPVAPPMPNSTSEFFFPEIADYAQSWATMTAAGVPYLKVSVAGDASGEASASWTQRIVVPGTGTPEVLLRFTMPSVSVNGRTEENALAQRRARLRADLLVNGFPAWSHEAMRFNFKQRRHSVNGGGLDELPATYPAVFQSFGALLPYKVNDEDAVSTNDSGSAVDQPAAPRLVILSLGRFPAGSALHLSLALQASALTLPFVPGSTDNRCKFVNNQYACTGAVVTVDGTGGEGPLVYVRP